MEKILRGSNIGRRGKKLYGITEGQESVLYQVTSVTSYDNHRLNRFGDVI